MRAVKTAKGRYLIHLKAPQRASGTVMAMEPKFVTLTLNPALDLSAEVDHLAPAHKLRCRAERRQPGGGGINVARVLSRLGADAVAVFSVAGITGQLLDQLLAAEGVAGVMVPVAGETRENITIDEKNSGQQYRFVFEGPPASPAETEACLVATAGLFARDNWLVASGSLAPGMPDDTYLRLGHRALAAGVRFVLDASGPAMLKALPTLYLLKVSESELEHCIGAPMADRDRCIAGARLLLDSGPKLVVVTRGDKGALLVSRDFVLEAQAPAIKPRSTVGAGDSFLAALVWELSRGRLPAQALATAVAAGSAALLQPGTELAHADDIMRIAPRVQVQHLPEPAIC